MTTIRFLKRFPFATAPSKATPDSCGYDLFATTDIVIPSGKTETIDIGVALEIRIPNVYARIASRSSLAQAGIQAVGGVIDPDYRGEIKVLLFNSSTEPFYVQEGSRVAQLIFESYRSDIILEESEGLVLQPTMRGTKGFGSSGV